MKSLKIDLQYFANYNWYKKIDSYKYIYLSLYDNHSKMSFRNRMVIAGADGPLRLSVPIAESRNERQLYKAVKLMDTRWQKEHFRAIVSCYNRSPWFEHYSDELAVLYKTPFTFLADWNMACLELVERSMRRSGRIVVIDDAAAHLELMQKVKEGEVEDWTNRIVPGGENQPDKYPPQKLPVYRQVFHEKTGFVAGLSIIDVISCLGPDTNKWLDQKQ